MSDEPQEPQDPMGESNQPDDLPPSDIPQWVWLLIGAAIISFMGSMIAAPLLQQPSGSNSYLGSTAPDKPKRGQKIYQAYCGACHLSTGQGVAGQYPSLVGSTYTNGNPYVLAAIIINGVKAGEGISGTKYANVMTGWGTILNDYQVANIMNFTRTSWGNSAGEVTAEMVLEVRGYLRSVPRPLTKADLDVIAEKFP